MGRYRGEHYWACVRAYRGAVGTADERGAESGCAAAAAPSRAGGSSAAGFSVRPHV
nr:MAG TPA: hypothetical protein [Caudoviricetes sp.]